MCSSISICHAIFGLMLLLHVLLAVIFLLIGIHFKPHYASFRVLFSKLESYCIEWKSIGHPLSRTYGCLVHRHVTSLIWT